MNLLRIVSLFLAIFATTVCALKCYNCDPKNDIKRCYAPNRSHLKPTAEWCPDDPEKEFFCISSYVSSRHQHFPDGPYRGCFGVPKNASEDVCSLYLKELRKNHLVYNHCSSCKEDLCNSDEYRI